MVYTNVFFVAQPLQYGMPQQSIPMKIQSTYSLLVNSHDTGRNIFEGAVYALAVLSTVASVLQFAFQLVTVPVLQAGSSATASTLTAHVAPASVPARS